MTLSTERIAEIHWSVWARIESEWDSDRDSGMPTPTEEEMTEYFNLVLELLKNRAVSK